MKKVKVCFCALSAYPLLSGNGVQFIGGAELQQVLIARELVHQGYDVSFIVFDHGQEPLEIYDDVKVYKTIPTLNAFSSIRAMLTAAKTIWDTLRRIDADVYFQECSGYFTGFIAFFCKLEKKKFIYQMASDMDADINHLRTLRPYVRALYLYGLKRANVVVAQSFYQKQQLRQNFNLDSIVIKNPFPIENFGTEKADPPIVLWVGTIKPEWKQPEVFLQLAREMPNVEFQMIGGPSSNIPFYESIRTEARTIPNLEFLGFVRYPQVNEYFEKASLLVNTSSVEGFSNTFLQAWAAHIPVVSLNVDPDELICRNQMGFHSGSFSQMVIDIDTLLRDSKMRAEMGNNGRSYVETEHDINTIVRKYADILYLY
jgi:glycosyltransferase involved in cell wall biosynthesis